MALSLSIRLGLAGTNGVSIIGSARVGSILGLSAVYLNGDGPDMTYRAQWYADGVAIGGAVGSSYGPVPQAYFDQEITAQVTDPEGNVYTSQPVRIIASVATPVVSGTPPVATVSAPFSWAPTVSGGSEPYTFSVVGALPAGFSLDAATGIVSATNPGTAGSTTVTIVATDSLSVSGSEDVTFVVQQVPAALVAGDWTVVATQGDPSRPTIRYNTVDPTAISGRYQSIDAASSSWVGAGNRGVTGLVAPQVGVDYPCSTPVIDSLKGKSIKIRLAFVADWGQTNIPFASADIKTVDLAPLVSAVSDTVSGTTATITCTTTGSTGTIYAAPMASDPTGTLEEQARAIKAASIALGASWRATVSASGTQTITVTGLAAGQTYSPVHVVHETPAGLIGNWTAGDGFATAGAVVPALNITEPASPITSLDGGTRAAFYAAPNAAPVSVTVAGTTTAVSTGTDVALALVGGVNAPDIELFQGLSGSPTLTQALDAIETNAPTWYAGFTATDTRTPAQFATAHPYAALSGTSTVRFSSGSGDRHVVIEGVDWGDYGLWADFGWQVTLKDVRLAGINVTNGSSINGTNVQIVGRGDGSELWNGGWSNDAIRADCASDVDITGLLITGHPRDALKRFGVGATGNPRRGKFRITGAYINAPVQFSDKPAPYSATRAYLPGDVFYPPGVSSGTKYWRVLVPFTDYVATTGQPVPPLASGNTNSYILYQDTHADGMQDISSNEDVLLRGVVWDYRLPNRIKGPTNLNSGPFANAAMFVSWPDLRGVNGPSRFQGIRVRDPLKIFKAIHVVGTTTNSGTTRPPAQATFSGLQVEDVSARYDIKPDAICSYRDMTDLSGNALSLPSPAAVDATLPAVTGTSIQTPLASTQRLSQGVATVSAGAWSKTISIPYSGEMTWAISATIAAQSLSDTTANAYRVDLSAPPSGNTYTTTIDAFPTSPIFYDSGQARGANAVDVPLSGDTTAPDGSVIEAQLVDATTLAVVHSWQNIATASGGSWSGEYLTAQRYANGLKAETRVANSTAAVARTTQEIRIGHILMLIGQSEDHHMTSGTYDNSLQTTPTLVDAASASRVYLMQWSEGGTQTFAANGIKAINPTNRGTVPGVTRSMVHMADVLTRNAPGENFLFIAAVQSGTSYADLVDDTVGPRDWNQTLGDALTYIRQWGADVGVLMSTWTAAPSTISGGYRVGHYPIFSGLYADTPQATALPAYGAAVNTTYCPAGYRLDHGFWDLSGLNRAQAVFDPAVTKMFFYGPHRFEDTANGIGKFATATSGVVSATLDVQDPAGMDLGSTTPVRFWTQGSGLASTETIVIEGSANGSTGWTTVATQAGSTSAQFMVTPSTAYRYYRATITKTGGGSVTANVYATGVSGVNTNKQDCRNLIRAMVADSVLSPIMLPKGPEILTYQNGYGTASVSDTTYEPTPANWVSWRDYAHPSEYTDDGLPARARHTAVAMLYALGIGPAPATRRDVPKFNRTYWDPAGAFVQLWYEDATGACPRISTTRIERSEAAIPATYPHRTVVAGFYRNSVPCTNVTIAAGVSTPGNSNVVQINAAGDPFDYTDVIAYGLGGASGVVQWPQDEYDSIWKNLPIAITGITGVTGVAIEPMPSTAALANPLPAPQTFALSNATLVPRFTDTVAVGSQSEWTFRWKGKLTSLSGDTLFSVSGGQMSIKRRTSGTTLTRRIEIISQDSGGTGGVIATTNTGVIVADNQVVDLVVSFSFVAGNRIVKLFIDGTQVWTSALTGSGTSWSTNRIISVFQVTGSGTPTGETEIVQIWKAYTSDGNYGALGTPYKEISAGSGGSIVETPSTPVWRVA